MSGLLIGLLALAAIIAGETGNLCGLDAKIGLAWVAHNREAAGIVGGWTGHAQPTALDIAVAETYQRLADPTHRRAGAGER